MELYCIQNTILVVHDKASKNFSIVCPQAIVAAIKFLIFRISANATSIQSQLLKLLDFRQNKSIRSLHTCTIFFHFLSSHHLLDTLCALHVQAHSTFLFSNLPTNIILTASASKPLDSIRTSKTGKCQLFSIKNLFRLLKLIIRVTTNQSLMKLEKSYYVFLNTMILLDAFPL